MVQRRRIFLSALFTGVLLGVLCMPNLTQVRAAPKRTPTPAVTPTPVPTLPPGSYYVSVGGSDTNPGTLAAAAHASSIQLHWAPGEMSERRLRA